MRSMTDHIEGSAHVHQSIWEKANDERLAAKEAKAERRARDAGLSHAVLKVSTFADRLRLEGRGWKVQAELPRAMALSTTYEMTRALTLRG